MEIRDIIIPKELEDAMSRQAQAERERQSRIILSKAEEEIAESFERASEHYRNNQTALHLRAMNMVFEGFKNKGSMIIVPSTAVETMGLGAMGGLTAFDRILERGESEADAGLNYDAERGAVGTEVYSFGDAAWWALVTVTTVGYGDIAPVTGEGRIVAAGLMMVGVALFGVATASVAAWFVRLTSVKSEKKEAASVAHNGRAIKKLNHKVVSLEAKIDLLVERSERDTSVEP